MIKLIEWIRNYLPVSRREYLNTMKKVTLTFQAMAQSEAQHAQLEMNMIQSLEELRGGKPSAGDKNKNGTPKPRDPSYN